MLDRWRSNPISFIETVLHDPETKQPFKLLPAERAFLEHAFTAPDPPDRLSFDDAPATRASRCCCRICTGAGCSSRRSATISMLVTAY
jgi:hypothetical protein